MIGVITIVFVASLLLFVQCVYGVVTVVFVCVKVIYLFTNS